MAEEESSTTSYLSDATTTTEESTITAGNTMTSSSSRGTEFFFHVAIVVIGVIGTAANGLVLYALVASKQHKKHVLIVNQNALDLFSCIFLVISYSVKLCNIRLTRWLGYWLCMLILNDSILWWGLNGSIINLAVITIERYLKIVHSAWSKTKLRSWMIYSAMAFAWIGSVAYCNLLVFLTCTVIDGVCYVMIFKSEASKLFWVLWRFVSFYVIILCIFIFCYGRILLVVRRQAKVMSGHAAAGSNTSQNQLTPMEISVIKTMILVCGFYAVTWLPVNISHMIMALSPIFNQFLISGYYATLFLAFLYTCSNPFIYAIKFDPVKQILFRMIPCQKISDLASQNVNNT